jgi:hypothetical protein
VNELRRQETQEEDHEAQAEEATKERAIQEEPLTAPHEHHIAYCDRLSD